MTSATGTAGAEHMAPAIAAEARNRSARDVPAAFPDAMGLPAIAAIAAIGSPGTARAGAEKLLAPSLSPQSPLRECHLSASLPPVDAATRHVFLSGPSLQLMEIACGSFGLPLRDERCNPWLAEGTPVRDEVRALLRNLKVAIKANRIEYVAYGADDRPLADSFLSLSELRRLLRVCSDPSLDRLRDFAAEWSDVRGEPAEVEHVTSPRPLCNPAEIERRVARLYAECKEAGRPFPGYADAADLLNTHRDTTRDVYKGNALYRRPRGRPRKGQ